MTKDIKDKDPEHMRYHISAAFFLIVFLILIGTLAYSYLEGWTVAQSFYFSVSTLTTVGYGDLHPTSEESMVFTAVYILFGVGMALGSITVIATDRINRAARRLREYAARKDLKEE